MLTDQLNVALSKEKYESGLNDWIQQEKAAIELIHILGSLWYDRSVELIIFRNQVVDRSASQILALHQYAKEIVKKPISIYDSLVIARSL
jgi:glyceraldehyde 3-phosphate dehydrogenase